MENGSKIGIGTIITREALQERPDIERQIPIHLVDEVKRGDVRVLVDHVGNRVAQQVYEIPPIPTPVWPEHLLRRQEEAGEVLEPYEPVTLVPNPIAASNQA